MANLMRVRMRARLAAKAWNEFIENFDQVIMEGYDTKSVKDEYRRMVTRGKSFGKVFNKIMKDTIAHTNEDKFAV